MSIFQKSLSIATSSGSGQTTVDLNALIVDIRIVAPTSTASYDFELQDSDGYGVLGRTGLVGHSTIGPIEAHVLGRSTILISNSSPNGTYSVKIMAVKGV